MLASRAWCKIGQPGPLGASKSSFLPFLYQTKTIARHFADENYAPMRASASDRRKEDDGRKALNTDRGARDGSRREPGSVRSTRTRASHGKSDERPRRTYIGAPATKMQSSRPRTQRRDAEKEIPIPFEGKVPSENPMERIGGSTMTPRELRTFEKLFKVRQVKGETAKQRQELSLEDKGYKPHSKRYGASGDIGAGPEFPDLLRPLAEEAALLRAKATQESPQSELENNSLTAEYPEEVAKRLETVKSKMDKASTDVALWNILQDEVFKKIREMPQLSNTAREFQVLAQTLSKLLLHFMELIREAFPGSSLGLVLIPTLKKLGPSAFALGATTDLFNEHMQLLYRHYADLDSIAETLSEMDKNVYEFNAGTHDLLASILKDARSAASGQTGPGLQALWSTDRKIRGLEKLRRWNGIVEERIRAVALREARDKQVVLEEEEEEQNDLRSSAM